MPKLEKTFELTLEKLRAAQERVAALQEKLAIERRESLVGLHEAVGFSSRGDLIAALERLAGGGRARSNEPNESSAPRSKRARITPEMRAGIIQALKGGKTGVAVAVEFGISNPSLHNIKKAAGLVKDRTQ